MQNPTVSFVVPCYNLAHLLPECVHSILSQSYRDFEVLIMDDCSPDNTPQVAQSFRDPRVKHIRNDPNLGHLRNYNEGFRLSRGRYFWLISADDYLRVPGVLQRYVELLEQHPEVGYAFCPGVGVGNSPNSEMAEWVLRGQSLYGKQDRIIPGHVLAEGLLAENTIVAASGLVRRECYENVSYFPLNMPWAGDWYLWCVFAMFYDVAYFAEPMVCYREHAQSMTASVMQERVEACAAEEIEILWTLLRRAESAGFRDLAKPCRSAVAAHYVRSLAGWRSRTGQPCLTLEQFEASVSRAAVSAPQRDWVRARVYARMADYYAGQGQRPRAKVCFQAALKADPWMPKVWAKRFLPFRGRSAGT
jgi:glycosyltransferase involved in cell wall biosynthesis